MLKKFLIQNTKLVYKIQRTDKINGKENTLFQVLNYPNNFNFSTSFIKNLQIQQKMDPFQKTLTLLNSLIQRLQANTGGEVKQDQAKKQAVQNIQSQVKAQSQTQMLAQIKGQEIKQEQNKETKNTEKKAKQAVNKEPKNKEKKQAQKKEPQGNEPKQIDPKFFAQVDIRIGEIVQCWKHPQSENLYCEKINIGKQVRQIASGLQKYVLHQNMKGKVLVMVNLKARPLAGFPSNGMVVCASTLDHTNVQLLVPEGPIGERVYLQGHQDLFAGGDILPVLNPKRKVVEKSLEHFKTDAQGFVVWQGIRLRTKAGFIKASNINNGNVG